MKKSKNEPLVEYSYRDHRDYLDDKQRRESLWSALFLVIAAAVLTATGYGIGWITSWLWRHL